MKNGYIYKPNEGKNRKVLMFDERETFYEIVNEQNELVCANYRTMVYSRMPTSIFMDTSTVFLKSNLTKKEELIHKPHLPLRLNCFKETFWSPNYFDDMENFKSFLISNQIDYKKFDNLNTDKVVIIPHGQQNSFKRPILLESKFDYFEGIVLMYNCFNLQQQYVNPEKNYFSNFTTSLAGKEEKRLTGFGLYRAGIKGNIPSYYLGGYKSLLELSFDDKLIV